VSTPVLTVIMVNTKDKYSMEDDISCYMCSDEVNLGDDYRVHLDTAHGIKKNFNYFMQQAVNEKMRRKTGKKPEVVDVVDVDSKEDDKDEAEMDSEEETTLSEGAENNDEQGTTKVSEAVERSLAKGLSDIVDMCEGKIELDYDDEDLEDGKDYEKELWEAFEELEALNNNRETKKTKPEQSLSSKKPTVVVPNKQMGKSGLAERKLPELKTSQEEKVSAAEARKPFPTGLTKTLTKTRKVQEEKAASNGLQSAPKPSIEKPELKKTNIKVLAGEELGKEIINGEVPWFERGIFFVCKSFIFDESRTCGRRCSGRKIFKEHLILDHGVKTIGSNTKVLRTFASDFDDQARYKCKECQIEVFHDRCGIEAHMERHPKLTLESYSEKHEKTVGANAEKKKGKEASFERIPEKAQMKIEVEEKSADSDLAEKKVKVVSSPAKSIMSNSSSNPGMIKMKRCPKCDFQTDEAGMLAQVGAIHLTKEHSLTALGMKENPKQWKFRTVKVPAS